MRTPTRIVLLQLSIFMYWPMVEARLPDSFYSSFSGKLIPSHNRSRNRTCGKHFLPKEVQFRSMGSTIVENNEYPWTIGMRIDSPESTTVCSSVLISTRHILTAAHCVTTRIQYYANNKVLCKYKKLPMSAIYVYPGTKVKHMKNIPPFTSSFRVVNMTIHNAYDPCKRGYDIALLEISPNMFSAGSAICMPSVNETIPKSLTSTGFGWNPDHPDTGMLQAVNLTVYGKTDYDEIETRTVDRIPCFGDSGGPLFTVKNGSYILLGITAQSELCVKENDEKVAVFEDVRTKITWICENSGVCPTESTTFK